MDSNFGIRPEISDSKEFFTMGSIFRPGSVVLFQGDRVTDCGRVRGNDLSLGDGYPLFFATAYNAAFPDSGVKFIDRAVSGNRVRSLLERYDDDFRAVAPDYIFIEIGVNDTWRRFDSDDPCPIERFSAEFRELLKKLTADLPDAKITILTPFLMRTIPERFGWHFDLDEKIAAEKAIAAEFGADVIDLQEVLDAAIAGKGYTDAMLTADSVHPCATGHAVIAAGILDRLRS